MNKLSRFAATLASFLVLISCGSSEPRTQGSDGRAVAPASVAVNTFMEVCFKTGGKRAAALQAIQRNANLTSDDSPSDPLYFADHKSLSINVNILNDGVCAVSFDNGKSNVEAGSEAAKLLIPQIGVKSIGGKRGGGQINLKTGKGTVVIGNNAKAGLTGASLSLFQTGR